MKQDKGIIRVDQWDNLVSMFAGANVIDGMLSSEIDTYRFKIDKYRPFPEIYDISLDIIVLQGELKVTIDYKTWTCSPNNNNFISVKPMNRLLNIEISDNFKGFAIALSRNFIIKHSFRPNISIDTLMTMRFFPVLTIEPAIINNLTSIISRIERNFTRDVFCKNELVLISMAEFHMEKIIVMLKSIDINNVHSQKSRKMQICFKFFDLVLAHCKIEHEVNFYANQLCITTQYLTRVLQEYYSRSAKEIIHYFLLSEAVILLYSDMTMQQIADSLNFADQSSFGKFFKKNMGVSPSVFRENEINRENS